MPIDFPSRPRFSVPILCYHALHASGPDYCDNDHVALIEDLQVIRRAGYRILALSDLVDALRHQDDGKGLRQGRFVCLTFDDGPNVDYFDYADPVVGLAKSFHRILVEFRVAHPEAIVDPDKALAVSFLIASEEARTTLDRSCIAGRGDWSSCWWRACAAGGVIALGNHSWDHLHVSLPVVAQRTQRKGSFHAIDNDEDACVQVAQAREYIESVLGMPCTRYFAYPYGHASKYLVNIYFPDRQAEHLHLAAFGTGGRPATAESNVWNIPRFVCGEHWQSSRELEELLQRLAQRSDS
ncbi:MAG: polysaccharide deacetylase family protein [Betaproteobacteria bacterium]|nr:polysaccharide deacetylase family protein [Betaproteobacteria bacterium]